MKNKGERAFTIIELVVVVSIVALIMPVLGVAIYQVISVPEDAEAQLSAIRDISQAQEWITIDANESYAFVPVWDPDGGYYGTFHSYTKDQVKREIRYRWNSQDHTLIREESIPDTTEANSYIVGSGVNNYEDIGFSLDSDHFRVHVKMTFEGYKHDATKQTTFSAALITNPEHPWRHRVPITLSNGGDQTLTDYQVRVVLEYETIFQNAQVSGDDVRFYPPAPEDDNDKFPYWIESWDFANSVAKIWVRVGSIPEGNSTIYMYYGNPLAEGESSFEDTFDPMTVDAFYGTYTCDADFDEGILVGVEHETVNGQLQLSTQAGTLPFIWVSNDDGTISKIDTETGDELGRYRVAPHDYCNPSRTTVDLYGNCWVGVREAGTVVKVGLYEVGQWQDRNGDGICQTSRDLNEDGDITGDEILPWGDDECVLYEVVLYSGYEGTYVPGTYPGPYDYDYWSTAPRGLAIDAQNNVWAGTSKGSMKFYYIDGTTGLILDVIDVSQWSHGSYGALIDSNGILWSSGQNRNHVLRLDPSTNPPTITTIDLGHFSYGMGIDYLGHLFISGWTDSKLTRIDIETGTKDWTKDGPYKARGVVCTDDNDVWIASTEYDKVYRYDNNGNLKTEIDVGDGPTGVAVDSEGKVWVCNINDDYIERIHPGNNTVELWKSIVGSNGHYTYSDMTGIVARTVTTKIGSWTTVIDSQSSQTHWGAVYWNSEEPAGTSFVVKARSSDDQSNWSAWEDVANGDIVGSALIGRYLQVETTFQIFYGEVSPILYDLTAQVVLVGEEFGDSSFYDKPGTAYVASGALVSGAIPVDIATRFAKGIQLSWSAVEPTNTSVDFQIEYSNDGGLNWQLIPDTDLVGNSIGLDTDPIDVSSVGIKYEQIRLIVNLSAESETVFPQLQDWTITLYSRKYAEPGVMVTVGIAESPWD